MPLARHSGSAQDDKMQAALISQRFAERSALMNLSGCAIFRVQESIAYLGSTNSHALIANC
jgi:hypothetical protein